MDQKAAIADRIKQANNILVTVSNNPSVDQLAACIALTLAVNKLDKHATAVFSGSVPSTIEFLQPEKTLEKNTDSLRDFIISLDKSKADKLRYKVEDKVVKIFITPYRTSINQKDLDFSQGDFNVDVVVALGVHSQQDLDQAITSHGRILHDAVIATVNIKPGGDLGTMNWLDTNASSLSELVTELIDVLDPKMIDEQMATALLAGIVAETDRFSNDRTTPAVMSISAELMGAGANQQLVATKLQEPLKPAPVVPADEPKDEAGQESEPPKAEDGTLEINHPGKEGDNLLEENPPAPPEPENQSDSAVASESTMPQIHIDDQGALHSIEEQPSKLASSESEPEDKGSIDPVGHMGSSRMILQPPSLGGQLTASGMPEDEADIEAPSGSPANNPISLPPPASPTPSPSPMPVTPQIQPAAPLPPSPMPQAQQVFQPPAMPPAAPPQPLPSAAPLPELAPMAPPAPMPAPAALPPVPPQPVMPPADAVLPPSPTQFAPAMPPPPLEPTPPPPPTLPSTQTLSEIEKDIDSPHAQAYASPTPDVGGASFTPQQDVTPPAPEPPAEPAADDGLESARKAVADAINSAPAGGAEPPIEALNARPLGAPLHDPIIDPTAAAPPATPASPAVIEPNVIAPTSYGNMPPPPMPPPMMPPTQSL